MPQTIRLGLGVKRRAGNASKLAKNAKNHVFGGQILTFWGAGGPNAPQNQKSGWEFLRCGICEIKHFFFGKIPSGSDPSYIAKVGLLKFTIVNLLYSDKEIIYNI